MLTSRSKDEIENLRGGNFALRADSSDVRTTVFFRLTSTPEFL
uniref:Uncharacterized protein n=1 Tax=Lepeophtheirus salmonis TaxID=72036 RepID=A0A0K2V9F7_LEPSM